MGRVNKKRKTSSSSGTKGPQMELIQGEKPVPDTSPVDSERLLALIKSVIDFEGPINAKFGHAMEKDAEYATRYGNIIAVAAYNGKDFPMEQTVYALAIKEKVVRGEMTHNEAMEHLYAKTWNSDSTLTGLAGKAEEK